MTLAIFDVKQIKQILVQIKGGVRPWIGIGLILVQCAIVANVNLLVSLSVKTHPLDIALIRLIIHFTLSLPFLLGSKTLSLGPHKAATLIMIRSISSIGSLLAQIFALAYATSISNVQTLTATAPLYVIILGAILLNEKIEICDFCLLLLSLTGIVLIMRPAFIFGSYRHDLIILDGHNAISKNNTLGYCCAIAAALCAAINMITTRKVSSGVKVKTEKAKTIEKVVANPTLADLMAVEILPCEEPKDVPPGSQIIRVPFYIVLFYTSSFGILVIGIIKVILKICSSTSRNSSIILAANLLPTIPCHSRDKIYILTSSFVSVLGQLALYLALRFEKAGLASIYRTAGVGMTFILDIAVLGTIPAWNSWVGAGLVCFSITTLAFRHYRVRNNSQNYNSNATT